MAGVGPMVAGRSRDAEDFAVLADHGCRTKITREHCAHDDTEELLDSCAWMFRRPMRNCFRPGIRERGVFPEGQTGHGDRVPRWVQSGLSKRWSLPRRGTEDRDGAGGMGKSEGCRRSQERVTRVCEIVPGAFAFLS